MQNLPSTQWSYSPLRWCDLLTSAAYNPSVTFVVTNRLRQGLELTTTGMSDTSKKSVDLTPKPLLTLSGHEALSSGQRTSQVEIDSLPARMTRQSEYGM
jgi:hypothetical protein